MMYYDENIRDRNTVVCDDWNNACSLMKALWEISHEPGAVGEYAVCVTDENGSIRVDFKFVPYDDDSVVFCTESELYEMQCKILHADKVSLMGEMKDDNA